MLNDAENGANNWASKVIDLLKNHFCNVLLYVLINSNYVNSYHVNLNVCYDMYITRNQVV